MLSAAITGPDGIRYYAPSIAGKRLGRTSRQIDTMIDRPDNDQRESLRSSRDPAVLKLHRGPGRPPQYLVLAEDVERIRGDLLRALGVEVEIEALKSDLTDVRSAWEREVLALRARVSDLETQNDATLNAFEKRLDAAIAQTEADRQFLRALRSTSSAGPFLN